MFYHNLKTHTHTHSVLSSACVGQHTILLTVLNYKRHESHNEQLQQIYIICLYSHIYKSNNKELTKTAVLNEEIETNGYTHTHTHVCMRTHAHTSARIYTERKWVRNRVREREAPETGYCIIKWAWCPVFTNCHHHHCHNCMAWQIY